MVIGNGAQERQKRQRLQPFAWQDDVNAAAGCRALVLDGTKEFPGHVLLQNTTVREASTSGLVVQESPSRLMRRRCLLIRISGAATIHFEGRTNLWVYCQGKRYVLAATEQHSENTCNCGNGAKIDNFHLAMVLQMVHLTGQWCRTHVDIIRRRLEATKKYVTQDSIQKLSLTCRRQDKLRLSKRTKR